MNTSIFSNHDYTSSMIINQELTTVHEENKELTILLENTLESGVKKSRTELLGAVSIISMLFPFTICSLTYGSLTVALGGFFAWTIGIDILMSKSSEKNTILLYNNPLREKYIKIYPKTELSGLNIQDIFKKNKGRTLDLWKIEFASHTELGQTLPAEVWGMIGMYTINLNNELSY